MTVGFVVRGGKRGLDGGAECERDGKVVRSGGRCKSKAAGRADAWPAKGRGVNVLLTSLHLFCFSNVYYYFNSLMISIFLFKIGYFLLFYFARLDRPRACVKNN